MRIFLNVLTGCPAHYRCRRRSITTSREGRAVVKLPRARKEDFPLILPSGPVFLRPKEEAYLAVTADNRYYLMLMEEELASCHVLGATRVCSGVVLRTQWTDGCLPALYRGEDVEVRRHCQEVPVQVPWVLSGGGGDPPQHRLWTAERRSYIVQCVNGTKHLRDWQPGVHAFQQDRECSFAMEAL